MYLFDKKSLRVAVLDLYEGQANQGMRCIRQLVKEYGESHNINIEWDEFDVRLEQEIPDLSYNVYISSGGPGSPLESKGTEWEAKYFNWIKTVDDYNKNPHNDKKHVLFICHSYQLA